MYYASRQHSTTVNKVNVKVDNQNDKTKVNSNKIRKIYKFVFHIEQGHNFNYLIG